MLFYEVKYFTNQNRQQTIGVKSAAKLTVTKFKKFMKAYLPKEEKQLIVVKQIEPISEEEIERRFGSTYIIIN